MYGWAFYGWRPKSLDRGGGPFEHPGDQASASDDVSWSLLLRRPWVCRGPDRPANSTRAPEREPEKKFMVQIQVLSAHVRAGNSCDRPPTESIGADCPDAPAGDASRSMTPGPVWSSLLPSVLAGSAAPDANQGWSSTSQAPGRAYGSFARAAPGPGEPIAGLNIGTCLNVASPRTLENARSTTPPRSKPFREPH